MCRRIIAAGSTALALALACAPVLAADQAQILPVKFLYIDRSGHTDEPLKLKNEGSRTSRERVTPDQSAALTTPAAPGTTMAGSKSVSHVELVYSPVLGRNQTLNIGFGSTSVLRAGEPERYFGVGPAMQRSYSVGLNVGYRGASLAAGLLHDESAGAAYSGVDVTLAYRWSSWSTAVQFANLAPDNVPLAIGPYENARLYSLQLGAAYSLTPGVTFSGGFKYQGFDSAGSLQLSRRQLLFLGTNINF